MSVNCIEVPKQHDEREHHDERRAQHQGKIARIPNQQLALRAEDQPGLVGEQAEGQQVGVQLALGDLDAGLVGEAAEGPQHGHAGHESDDRQSPRVRSREHQSM